MSSKPRPCPAPFLSRFLSIPLMMRRRPPPTLPGRSGYALPNASVWKWTAAQVGVRVDGVEIVSCRVRRTDHPVVLEFVSRNKYGDHWCLSFFGRAGGGRWNPSPRNRPSQDGIWFFFFTPLPARRFEGRLGERGEISPLPQTSAAGHCDGTWLCAGCRLCVFSPGF